MVSYESAVTIGRPRAVVFPFLTDTAKQALWSDVAMRQITPGELATGSRLEVTFGKGPLKATLGLEMTDVAAGSRMAFKTFSGPIDWQGEYRLEDAEGGATRISQHGTLKFSGLWRLLAPFIGAEIRSGEIKELERLKAVVEKG